MLSIVDGRIGSGVAGEKFSGAVFPDARSLNVSLSLFLFPLSLFSL